MRHPRVRPHPRHPGARAGEELRLGQVPVPVRSSSQLCSTDCVSSVGWFRPGECIFSGYVCDGEVDCSNGADEPPLATCENHEQEFTKVTSKLNSDVLL